MLTRRTACQLIAASCCAAAEPHWKTVYEVRGRASFVDLSASADGLAATVGRHRGASSIWVSSDAGEWIPKRLPDTPVSLQCSGDATIWMVGESGIWLSKDKGEVWRRVLESNGLLRVFFLNDQRGFACGDLKRILETWDGGATWSAVPAAAEPSTNPAHTAYHWIDFVSPKVGIIAGASRPPRTGHTSDLPAWRDPQRDKRRKEWPAASLTLETRDGGSTWKHSSTSLFGKITKVRYTRAGKGLALVEFHDEFEFPSEVFSIDLSSGKSERAFRRENRAVTDTLLLPDGSAMLAAIAPPEDPAKSTLGRVHLLRSQDLQNWDEMDIPELDAGRVWLAAGKKNVWAVTNTASILRFDLV